MEMERMMGDVRSGYHTLVRGDVLNLVPPGTGQVLDVGGGVGANGQYLKDHGQCERYVLIDLVADDVAPGVDAAFAGDLEDPELLRSVGKAEGPFDAILCLDVLEHLRDPWSVVAECHRMLAPGGALVVSLPNMRHISLTAPLVLRGRFDLADAGIMDRTHMRWFTRASAIEMLTGSGLRLDKVDRRIYRRLHQALNAVSFGLLEGHLAQQYFFRVVRPA